MAFQIVNNSNTSIDIQGVIWDDMNIIMMGLYAAKRILEARIASNPYDAHASGELRRVDRVIDSIQIQYPSWYGTGIGTLEISLADTLASAALHSNRATII